MLGDYPSSGGCFSGLGAAHQHGSAGTYGPPLIPPTHSSYFSSLSLPLSLCLSLSALLPVKWQLCIKLETHPVAFWGLTFISELAVLTHSTDHGTVHHACMVR